MRAFLSLLLAAFALCASAEASAFCVYNTLTDRQVRANVVGPAKPLPVPKIYAETVAPGKESCCNPKNAECNPERVPDSAFVAVEARIMPDAAAKGVPAAAAVPCGKPTTDARFPSGAESALPIRGSLRFERNPQFDARRPPGKGNAQYVLKSFAADNRLVATYFCPP
jgi:hypothetical protein